jgi:N-acyl-D-aspartate/D-glutamate deacylase
VIALGIPTPLPVYITFGLANTLEKQPGWDAIAFRLPHKERLRAFADPNVRDRLRQGVARTNLDQYRFMVDFAGYVIESSTHGDWIGKCVAELAQGADALDALLDIAIADDLKTVFGSPVVGADDASWRLRAKTWGDPRVLVGGSDAGAHLTMIDSFSIYTDFIGNSVRGRKLIGLEKAVQLITSVPAALLGLVDRGRIAAGYWADIVIFDPDRLGPGTIVLKDDLPGNAERFYSEPAGMEHVIVNGVEIIHRNVFTGTRSGRVLRGGRDTAGLDVAASLR